MTVAVEDMRAMSDEQLQELYAADEPAALAEAARRDRAERGSQAREGIRAEWYDAAHAQYLAAEAETPREPALTVRVGYGIANRSACGLAARTSPKLRRAGSSGTSGRASPRLTVGEYARRMAIAKRAAREDTATGRQAAMIESSTDRGKDRGRRMTRGDFDTEMPLVLFEARRGQAQSRKQAQEAAGEPDLFSEPDEMRIGGEAMDDDTPVVAGGQRCEPASNGDRHGCAPARVAARTAASGRHTR